MNVIIKIGLKNSATLESPEAIEQMVRSRLDKMIAETPMLELFIDGPRKNPCLNRPTEDIYASYFQQNFY